MLRQCKNTVPTINILEMILEDKEYYFSIAHGGLMNFESEKLRRRLQCPQQEWPLLRFRVENIAQKILSSNIIDISDETVK